MAKAALRRLETWVILTRKRLITKGSRKRTDLLSNDHAASDDKFSASSTPKVANPVEQETQKLAGKSALDAWSGHYRRNLIGGL
ncbi:hypothetical protein CDAR_175541 [Caerostris darwini]|uniref:Uncharacterized protein n=1 Tax=Caerostris darwini TaxID=1538125 RepID=A0AAV4RZ76_9ARAC|nr:hypothetical protein CDAR_175541 [Caerostris darwini]